MMAGVAGQPADLVLVEVGEKYKTISDCPFPLNEIDGIREDADRSRREIVRRPNSEDVAG